MSDWSSLPCDLLCEIALKLIDFEDFVYFSVMCRQWNYACSLVKPKWAPRLPWLMLAENTINNPNCLRGLYSLSRNKCYKVKLPETFGARWWGSTNGWVVGIDLHRQFWLFNPVTHARISLPSETTLPQRSPKFPDDMTDLDVDVWIRTHTIAKAFVVKMGDDLLVVVIHGVSDGDRGYVAVAKPGDQTWIPVLSDTGVAARDVVVWDDQRIFVLDCDGCIRYFDISGAKDSQSLMALDYINFKSPGATVSRASSREHSVNLVKSFDNLLLVLRYKEEDLHGTSCWTTRFEVFELDVGNREWKQLDGLGSNSLFVGENYFMSISAPAIGKYKHNCIYFTDDEHMYWDCRVVSDNGVFDMGTGSIEKFYEGEDVFLDFCSPFWFFPNF